jgi:hypothetical protein
MPDYVHFLTFGLVALGMVLTPGPNMIYLISRSICQVEFSNVSNVRSRHEACKLSKLKVRCERTADIGN